MYIFRTLSYPGGGANILLLDMIDINQVGIFIRAPAKVIGKAHFCMRVFEERPCGHLQKLTLTMAVCGSGDQYLMLGEKAGTITLRQIFIYRILDPEATWFGIGFGNVSVIKNSFSPNYEPEPYSLWVRARVPSP